MTGADRWAVPPCPEEGDAREKAIFMAVGYALSQWEKVELRLGALLAEFRAITPDEAVARLDYRGCPTFRARHDLVARAGEEFFASRCDQDLEGEWERLLSEARRASERRNDIAHGMAQLMAGANRRWASVLRPPANFVKHYPGGEPSYTFRAQHIEAFGASFLDLAFEMNAFHGRLRGEDAADLG